MSDLTAQGVEERRAWRGSDSFGKERTTAHRGQSAKARESTQRESMDFSRPRHGTEQPFFEARRFEQNWCHGSFEPDWSLAAGFEVSQPEQARARGGSHGRGGRRLAGAGPAPQERGSALETGRKGSGGEALPRRSANRWRPRFGEDFSECGCIATPRRTPWPPPSRLALLRSDATSTSGRSLSTGFYLNKKNYVAAINRFKVVVSDYQTTAHVEEALMRLTECYMALGVRNEAQTAVAILGHNFPESRWYKDAYALLEVRRPFAGAGRRVVDLEGVEVGAEAVAGRAALTLTLCAHLPISVPVLSMQRGCSRSHGHSGRLWSSVLISLRPHGRARPRSERS